VFIDQVLLTVKFIVDDRRRDNYMEEETALEKRWDTQILTARSETDIKIAGHIFSDASDLTGVFRETRFEGSFSATFVLGNISLQLIR
jgi:hypothetical protein